MKNKKPKQRNPFVAHARRRGLIIHKDKRKVLDRKKKYKEVSSRRGSVLDC